MVIAVIEEAHSDYITVVTRDKFKRKLLLNEGSQINYIGFDEVKKEMKAVFCVRVQVKKELISSLYVTPAIGDELVYPTREMVKMSNQELFKLADLNKNGRLFYVEVSKTIKHSCYNGLEDLQCSLQNFD